MFRKICYSAIVLFAVACSAGKEAATTSSSSTISEQEVNLAKTKYPTATAASLANGKAIYTTRCAQCHKLPNPESMSRDRWDKIYAKMTPKAKFSPEENQLVMEYINGVVLK